MVDWAGLFTLTTPLLEIFIRGTLMYLGILVLVRVAGQREFGALGITDLLVIVLIAEAASNGMSGEATGLLDGMALVGTILLWSVIIDAATYRWERLSHWLKAGPRQLIKNGEINHRVRRREFLTEDEIRCQLRLHGVRDLSEVAEAYIEPNGMVSLIRRDGAEPDEPTTSPAIG